MYAQSKLALTMYTPSLAEATGESLTTLSGHPGVVATQLLPVYGHSRLPVEEAAATGDNAEFPDAFCGRRRLLRRS